MITIEKFYFSYEEAAPLVSGGSDGTDWNIQFIGRHEEALNIKIVMSGREDFRKLIEQIYDIGIGMLEAGESETKPLNADDTGHCQAP